MWTIVRSLFGGWWVYGALAVGALAFGGYLGSGVQSKADQVVYARLQKTNDAVTAGLRSSIDDPKTGYRAQISTINGDLAVCRDTVAKQDKAITAQNTDVASWKAAADKATRAAAQAQADASALAREADQLAKVLGATKPQNVTYVDLQREALQ